MGQLPVAALARGREPPVDLAPLRLDLVLPFGDLPAFAPLLDAPALIIVLRVVGAALPVDLALQAAQALPIGGHLRAEQLEEGLLLGDHRQRARPQVQPYDVLAQLVLRLTVGPPLTDQLGIEAVAQPQLPTHEA